MARPETSPGWRPGLWSRVLLTVSVVFAVYVLSPVWWDQLGQDSRVFYAAGTLARSGGNPYDPAQIATAEARLAAPGAGTGPAGLTPATYANPPLFTSVLAIASRLSLDAFRGLVFAVLAASAVAGVEFCLVCLRWRERWLARAFMLSSSPLILGVFVGNTSPLLFLWWASGWLAMTRGRAVLGGALLSLLWLKPSVGLLVALALLVAGPGSRSRAAAGFAAGTTGLALLDLATSGPGAAVAWVRALTGYADALSLAGETTAFSSNANSLAGLPGAFLNATSTGVAVGLALLVVAVVVGWALHHGRLRAIAGDDLARAGLAMAAVLAISPYLHLNDLVLEAAPLALVAGTRLTIWARAALTLWTVGALVKILLTLMLAALVHYHVQEQALGFGVLLNAATLMAAAAAVRVRHAAR